MSDVPIVVLRICHHDEFIADLTLHSSTYVAAPIN